jgi:hypothetical protein
MFCALTACRTRAPEDTRAPDDAAPAFVLDVGRLDDLSPTLPDAGKTAFRPPDPATITDGPPAWGKSVGHTSVVLHLRLKGGAELAFKPESRRGKARYRGEIAAYRLAKALGLTNVLPAVPRAFDVKALEAVLEPASREVLRSEAVVTSGKVRGAAIVWLQKLEFIPLEGASWRNRWKGWLGSAELPDDQRELAAQIATLIVFDMLGGNWDRWSGGNVAIDRPTNTLLFVDNDGAFFDPVPPEPLAAQQKQLEKTERFSRALVDALRKMTPVSLADALGEDLPGTPLLGARVVSGIDERRRVVLTHVDELIKGRGEAATLAFP